MSIIEQAARRLEELKRAGVEVPWAAAGIQESEADDIIAAAKSGEAKAPASAGTKSRAVAPRVAANADRLAPSGNVTHPTALAAAEPDGADRIAPEARIDAPLVETPPDRKSKLIDIDLVKLGANGYLIPDAPRSALADEFRGIKHPILRNIRGESDAQVDRANLIMVTSALPGEGKTFCSVNLALSIASEVDSSVLLVDADVVRPAVMARLGLEGNYDGLLELLSGKASDVGDVLLRTNVHKLTLLPAGAPRLNSTELLASNAMARLVDELSRRYPDRIIIFDAPPLLVTTESRVLAARMGQILMVVDEGQTLTHDVVKAFSMLKGFPVVASILNKSRNQIEKSRYGYGYYAA